MKVEFKPIGIVHSPFKATEDIQPERHVQENGFDDVQGELEIFKEYEEALQDTEGFSHLIVLFVFHKAQGYRLKTKPPSESRERGLFSTRSPHRPNPIGLTVVKLLERKGNILKVKGIDMIEGSPILDIKPYTARDQKRPIKLGWRNRGLS